MANGDSLPSAASPYRCQQILATISTSAVPNVPNLCELTTILTEIVILETRNNRTNIHIEKDIMVSPS